MHRRVLNLKILLAGLGVYVLARVQLSSLVIPAAQYSESVSDTVHSASRETSHRIGGIGLFVSFILNVCDSALLSHAQSYAT